jgi:hypothetical protein
LRIECDRCGKVQIISQIHMPRAEMAIRDILARARHDGCGGRAAKRSWSPPPTPPAAAARCAGSCCWDERPLRPH